MIRVRSANSENLQQFIAPPKHFKATIARRALSWSIHCGAPIRFPSFGPPFCESLFPWDPERFRPPPSPLPPSISWWAGSDTWMALWLAWSCTTSTSPSAFWPRQAWRKRYPTSWQVDFSSTWRKYWETPCEEAAHRPLMHIGTKIDLTLQLEFYNLVQRRGHDAILHRARNELRRVSEPPNAPWAKQCGCGHPILQSEATSKN